MTEDIILHNKKLKLAFFLEHKPKKHDFSISLGGGDCEEIEFTSDGKIELIELFSHSEFTDGGENSVCDTLMFKMFNCEPETLVRFKELLHFPDESKLCSIALYINAELHHTADEYPIGQEHFEENYHSDTVCSIKFTIDKEDFKYIEKTLDSLNLS